MKLQFLFKDKYRFSVGVIIALNLMLTNYLYEFESGAVQGGELLRFTLKAIALIFIYSSRISFDKILLKNNLLLVQVFLIFFFSYLIVLPFSTFIDLQILNSFMTIPIVIGLGVNNQFDWFGLVFKIMAFFLVFVWLPIDLYLFINGLSLWKNTAFIGGVGNPSTYGVLCLFMFIYFSKSKPSYWNNLILLISSFSLIMSQAAMPIILFCSYLLFNFQIKHVINLFKILGLIFISIFLFDNDFINDLVEFFNDAHFSSKLAASYELISGETQQASESASIGLRIKYWEDLIGALLNPITLLLGHYNLIAYNAGDGQWVAYITSFGLPITLVLFYYIFNILNRGKKNVQEVVATYFVIFTLFISITNRLLDYWPFPIIFWFSIVKLTEFKKSEHENWVV